MFDLKYVHHMVMKEKHPAMAAYWNRQFKFSVKCSLPFGRFKGLWVDQICELDAGDHIFCRDGKSPIVTANDELTDYLLSQEGLRHEYVREREGGLRYLDWLIGQDWLYPMTRKMICKALDHGNREKRLIASFHPEGHILCKGVPISVSELAPSSFTVDSTYDRSSYRYGKPVWLAVGNEPDEWNWTPSKKRKLTKISVWVEAIRIIDAMERIASPTDTDIPTANERLTELRKQVADRLFTEGQWNALVPLSLRKWLSECRDETVSRIQQATDPVAEMKRSLIEDAEEADPGIRQLSEQELLKRVKTRKRIARRKRRKNKTKR